MHVRGEALFSLACVTAGSRALEGCRLARLTTLACPACNACGLSCITCARVRPSMLHRLAARSAYQAGLPGMQVFETMYGVL